MNFDDALQYLLSLGHETLAIKLGLTNTERLLEALGNPQTSFPSVQIAGTNGKGSTAVMLEAIARAVRLKTGLYTSPHLVNITERIRINNQEISREDFAHLTAQVRNAAKRLLFEGMLETLPTFFEHLTAIALVVFAEARVQLAILETGLGGRLDATTTARAQVVAITPVALDHQEYLGGTLAEIAAEKAAIIRPGVIALVAPQEREALDVILERCAASGVTPRLSGCQVKVTGVCDVGRVRATFETNEDCYENVQLGLRGRHQLTNASLAIALAEALRERGFPLPHEAIIEGLESARHAGRLELRRVGETLILFDGAHNAAGAHALRDFLDEFVLTPITLIFGAMRDKDLTEIAATLFPIARQLILTRPSNPRSASTEMLARFVPTDFDPDNLTLVSSIAEALKTAYRETPPGGLICITGSLYLVGEAIQMIDSGLAQESRKHS
ncbi:MAG: dihydrofolate synthase / folylpolyglutamate synthase [Acidobacteriota bacterium]|jgi:dihydrofolate synthase/folylpolyglutamate synthase|nr:dihydrofolate synthase / folylpolyglutamate synthase [Acidobacteriota bacterium]